MCKYWSAAAAFPVSEVTRVFFSLSGSSGRSCPASPVCHVISSFTGPSGRCSYCPVLPVCRCSSCLVSPVCRVVHQAIVHFVRHLGSSCTSGGIPSLSWHLLNNAIPFQNTRCTPTTGAINRPSSKLAFFFSSKYHWSIPKCQCLVYA